MSSRWKSVSAFSARSLERRGLDFRLPYSMGRYIVPPIARLADKTTATWRDSRNTAQQSWRMTGVCAQSRTLLAAATPKGGGDSMAPVTTVSKDSTSLPPSSSDKKQSERERNLEILGWLSSYVWPADFKHRARVVSAFSALLLGKVAAVQAPVQLAALIDALGAGPESIPVLLVCSFALARLAASGFDELRRALFARVSQDACRQVAGKAFRHLHSLDSSFLVTRKSGELQVIITRAVKGITQILNTLAFSVIPTAFEFSLVLGILWQTAGTGAACIAAGTVVVYLGFTALYSNMRVRLRQRMNKAEQAANGRLLDSIINAEVVRAFGNEDFEARRYDALLAKYERENVKVIESLGALNFGQQLIFSGGLCAVLLQACGGVVAGTVPVGTVVMISTLLFQLSLPLNFMGAVYRELRLNLVDMAKLHELMQQQPSVPAAVGPSLAVPRGEIVFDNVSFSFGGRQVLKGLNMRIPAGQKVALVGASGAGKSTILRLLMRLHDPQEGRILIDGQDIRGVDLRSLRAALGVVPQDCVLFHETIADNIRYGDLDASDAQVAEAARMAEIHDTIMSQPEQYETMVGERGLRMSGGERQRIGIARCILKNAPIVMFDEATSALDTETEHKILHAIQLLTADRTAVVVAHRLSTVADASHIVFLEDGCVFEEGCHADLVARSDGRYRALWDLQFQKDAS